MHRQRGSHYVFRAPLNYRVLFSRFSLRGVQTPHADKTSTSTWLCLQSIARLFIMPIILNELLLVKLFQELKLWTRMVMTVLKWLILITVDTQKNVAICRGFFFFFFFESVVRCSTELDVEIIGNTYTHNNNKNNTL